MDRFNGKLQLKRKLVDYKIGQKKIHNTKHIKAKGNTHKTHRKCKWKAEHMSN